MPNFSGVWSLEAQGQAVKADTKGHRLLRFSQVVQTQVVQIKMLLILLI